jgi:hypothetical protein
MTFEEWLIANGYDEDCEYPCQNYYSSSEWDELAEQYEEEVKGVI